MKLFDGCEPTNLADLRHLLVRCSFFRPPYSVAVEALLFDQQERWILTTRGPGCLGEIGKLDAVRTTVADERDFRSILRERLAEVCGDEALIEIVQFFEVRWDTTWTYEAADHKEKLWVIVSYICRHRSGMLQARQPDTNSGYRRLSLPEVSPSSLTTLSKAAFDSLRAASSEVTALLRELHGIWD